MGKEGLHNLFALLLDSVFDADHDAGISSGQGRWQLAAFQRQRRGLGAISGEMAGCQPASAESSLSESRARSQ
jgi:hypothetical protein